jgi:hypothetical protein
LNLDDIPNLDNAILNKQLRHIWLLYPKLLLNGHAFFSSSKQIDYCISRNIYLNRMAIMNIDSQTFLKLHYFSKHLNEFWMRDCDLIDEADFIQFIQTCTSLTEIDLLSHVTDNTLLTMAINCSELTTISLQCQTGKVSLSLIITLVITLVIIVYNQLF